jgi:hypothetical protein
MREGAVGAELTSRGKGAADPFGDGVAQVGGESVGALGGVGAVAAREDRADESHADGPAELADGRSRPPGRPSAGRRV